MMPNIFVEEIKYFTFFNQCTSSVSELFSRFENAFASDDPFYGVYFFSDIAFVLWEA